MPHSPDDSESIVLKPQVDRWGALIGSFVAAVVVNGGAVWMGRSVLSRFQHQPAEGTGIALLLVLTPFSLVGLWVALQFVWRVLGMFNPVPVLKLAPASVPLGGAATLTWCFFGRCDSIRSLTLYLKAFEQAQWTGRKTGGALDHVFYVNTLVHQSDLSQIEAGRLTLEIPAGSMHSFKSRHNSVNWQIELCAHMPRWPAVKATYPITVIPILEKLQPHTQPS